MMKRTKGMTGAMVWMIKSKSTTVAIERNDSHRPAHRRTAQLRVKKNRSFLANKYRVDLESSHSSAAHCNTVGTLPAMAKRHLHAYFIYFLIFLIMFRCVKACSYIGNSVRSLSNHQVRCEAYQKEEAHSAAIRKSVAARNKQKRVQQKQSGSNKVHYYLLTAICAKIYMELLAYHFRRCSTPSSSWSLNPTCCSKSRHARILRIS
jgi:hypothetical protein